MMTTAEERDAIEVEYERTSGCWKECEAYDLYHLRIDREIDRIDEMRSRLDRYDMAFGMEADEIDLNLPPFE